MKNGIDVSGMFCSIEDYAISPWFVPYCPSMAEMYAMIKAVKI